ncbi:transposase [Anaerorhabdus sp.]|uniref:transposase n=1 Tax=Anaerorhabdus sp. TaxID=1872524 RepID=UPI003FA60EB7
MLEPLIQESPKNYLHHYFQKFDKIELNHVKFVSIDMYEPYKIIANSYFKNAIIGIDSFHVINT